MFKKEIIQVEEIIPGDYALATCKKYNISGENIVGELKLGSGKLIVLTNSQIHFVDELTKQVETMKIYKPNFDEVKAEIDIRYYRNERNDDIEQTILKCNEQEKIKILVEKYIKNAELQTNMLEKRQEMARQEKKTFGIIATIFSLIIITIGVFTITQKSPILLIVLKWFPLYLLLIWLSSTVNLILHKEYTKENAVFTLFTGFGIASTLIMRYGFSAGNCLFIVLFLGPALCYLCLHWKEVTFIKKESVYTGITLLLTILMFSYRERGISFVVLLQPFVFFIVDIMLLFFYLVIGIFGLIYILDDYKWRIGILYTLIAISAACIAI